jgi:uncharacterized small protein (DUF1192 family)
MDTDDLAPPPKAPEPPDFETMSIEALNERIQDLEAEIARIREFIALKEAARGDADSFFKS